MSPFHSARLFKQSTGKSPYQYVVQARAKRAKELLKSGKFSIVEVAHRLGFADPQEECQQNKSLPVWKKGGNVRVTFFLSETEARPRGD